MHKRLCVLFGIGVAGIFVSSAAQSTIITLSGALDAAQVVDGGGSTSTATGFATVVLDDVLRTITTSLSWTGLTGPADRAHLHDAPAGVSKTVPPNDRFFHDVLNQASRTVADCGYPNGSLFNGCAPTTGSAFDVFVVPLPGDPSCSVYDNCDFADIAQIALADDFYIDMHTQLYPEGEIRGQMLVVANAVPEPASLMLFAIGALGLALSRWRGQPRTQPGRPPVPWRSTRLA